MATENFQCPFCRHETPSHETTLKASKFREHLDNEHDMKGKLFLTIHCTTHDYGGIFVMLPPTNTCPIGGCTRPTLQFDHASLGSHIRKMHDSKEKITNNFMQKLQNGDYLWWSGRRGKKFKESSAWINPTLYNQALAKFNESVMDDQDGALAEMIQAETTDNMDHLDGEEVVEALSQLSICQDPEYETHQPPGLNFEGHVQIASEAPSTTFMTNEYQDVIMPPAMGFFDFGLLHLRHFPNQPIVPVCLQCRHVISSTESRIIRRHWRKHQGHQEVEGVDTADSEDENQSMNEGSEEGRDMDSEDEAYRSQEDDVLDGQREVHGARKISDRWSGMLEDFLNSNSDSIHKLEFKKEDFPAGPIPCISFLPPPYMAYKCTRAGCKHVSTTESNAKKHSCKRKEIQLFSDSNTEMGSKEVDERTAKEDEMYQARYEPCLAQNLSRGDKSIHFVVVESPDAGQPAVSFGDQVRAFLEVPKPTMTNALPGPQFNNAMIRKFKYYAIWPSNPAQYETFLYTRIPVITVMHHRQQKYTNQLLAISIFIYAHSWRHALDNADFMIQSHFGNKSRQVHIQLLEFSEYGSQLYPAFRPISRTNTTHYAAVIAKWAVYIINVVADRDIDPDLQLHHDHIQHGKRILKVLEDIAKSHPKLILDLTQITRYPEESLMTSPPEIVKGERWKSIVEIVGPTTELLHPFLFSLVSQPLDQSSTISLYTPIHRFLSLISWNPQTKSFYQPHDFVTYMAKLQWMMRLIVLAEYHKQLGDQPDTQLRTLAALHDAYLVHQTLTPFGTLVSHLKFTGTLASYLTLPPNASWESWNKSVIYNGQRLQFGTFKNMLRGIMDKTRLHLNNHVLFNAKEILFGTNERFDFGRRVGSSRLGEIHDDMSNTTPGYSYVYSTNPFTKYRKCLSRHIEKTPELVSRFFLPPPMGTNGICPNYSAMIHWVSEVDVVLNHVAVCCYFLGGQPPRATELVAWRVSNTVTQARNLFCISNHAVIFDTYSKGQAKTDIGIPTYRVLAYELEELVEIMFTVVKPVYTRFCRVIHESNPNYLPHAEALMFTRMGQPMTSTEFSHTLRDITIEYIHHRWAVRAWRQVVVTFADRLLPPEIQQMQIGTSVIHAQTSHRGRAHMQNYARLQEGASAAATSHDYEKFRAASVEWHSILGFTHPHIPCGAPVYSTDPTNVNTVSVLDRAEFARSVARELNVYTSERYKDNVLDMCIQYIAKVQEDAKQQVKMLPVDIMVPLSTKRAFQKLFSDGSNREFRSTEQALGIQYVLTRQPNPLLVILPMGHGKTALYQVACLEEASTRLVTVVIVPLRALAIAAHASAEKIGIPTAVVSASINEVAIQGCMSSQLVIMTYDLFSLNKAVFTSLLTMANQGILARVVVDEAHTLITDSTFRENFKRVYPQLASLKIPLIFLTGTLPPYEYVQFQEMLSFHPICYVLRRIVDLPQIEYSKDSLEGNKDNIDEFVQLAKDQLMSSLDASPGDRAIIFCRTRNFTEAIAEGLGVGFYHSLADIEDRSLSLKRWLDRDTLLSRERMIVATTSLALGIDYPTVRNIWFFGDPPSLIDFAQMAARAGRDLVKSQIRLFPSSASITRSGQDLLESYKDDQVCRRNSLSSALNGCPLPCASVPDAVCCDVCSRHLPVASMPPTIVLDIQSEVPARRIVERDMRLSRCSTALFKIAELFQRQCPLCALQGEDNSHPFEQCGSNLAQHQAHVLATMDIYRQENYIPGLAICTYCHLPQSKYIMGTMNQHVKYVRGDGQPCMLQNTISGLVISLLSTPSLNQTILRYAEHQNSKHALQSLFRPVKSSPCFSDLPEKQLYILHFVLLASFGRLPFMPTVVTEVLDSKWFKEWSYVPNEISNPGTSLFTSLIPTLCRPTVETDDLRPKTQLNLRRKKPATLPVVPIEANEAEIFDLFAQGLQWLRVQCPICIFARDVENHTHHLCKTNLEKFRQPIQLQMRKRVKLADTYGKLCHDCYLPHDHPLHKWDPMCESECLLKHTVADCIIGILHCGKYEAFLLVALGKISPSRCFERMAEPAVPLRDDDKAPIVRAIVIILLLLSTLDDIPPEVGNIRAQAWTHAWNIEEAEADSYELFKPVFLYLGIQPLLSQQLDSLTTVSDSRSMDRGSIHSEPRSPLDIAIDENHMDIDSS